MKFLTTTVYGVAVFALALSAKADSPPKSPACPVEFHFGIKDGHSTTMLDSDQDKTIPIKMPNGFGKWKCFRDSVDALPKEGKIVGNIYCSNDDSDSLMTVIAVCSMNQPSEDSSSMSLRSRVGHVTFIVMCEGSAPPHPPEKPKEKPKDPSPIKPDFGTDDNAPQQSHDLTPTIKV